MYPQQHHMQMQHMQMMQQRHMAHQQNMRQQQLIQQQQQHQQRQQQILHQRGKHVHEKSEQHARFQKDHGDQGDGSSGDEDEEDDGDGEDEESEDVGEDDESYSSLSELSFSESDDDTDPESESTVDPGEESSPRGRSKPHSKGKSKTERKSKSKTKAPTKAGGRGGKDSGKTDDDAELGVEVAESVLAHVSSKVSPVDNIDTDDVTTQMKKLTMPTVAPGPASIPSSTLSPAEYMYNVISDVLDTNNKKNFQRILSRTPLPVALTHLHQIAQKAFSTGNRDIQKVVIETNKKYNIISSTYVDALAGGNGKITSDAMTYLMKTIQAFTAGAEINTQELLKYFTPEFIAMNLIQAGNIEAYDRVMAEFKEEGLRISRGFHVAKPLLAAYFGVSGFFSNQKRYTFNRDILVLAICGGNTETVDYVVKKTKQGKISRDVVLEARSCQPIPANMMKHLIEKYNVSEMSL